MLVPMVSHSLGSIQVSRLVVQPVPIVVTPITGTTMSWKIAIVSKNRWYLENT